MSDSPLSACDARTTYTLMTRLRAAVIRRWSLSDDAADDLVQATWLRLLERGAGFGGRSSLLTYAIGVANNIRREQARCAARRRAITARYEAEQDLGSYTPAATPADEAYDLKQDLLRASRAVEALDASHRWLIDARFVDDVPYETLLPRYQTLFGSSIRTQAGLRVAIHHAKRRLRVLLERGVSDSGRTPERGSHGLARAVGSGSPGQDLFDKGGVAA
ncbi:MAG TPA: sigma-70 family RNA polymerase sigma factor [Myxococcota bacterium]|nr:sigma-70 family RNA polymerase sigma factor [Myxococcota bacterium]